MVSSFIVSTKLSMLTFQTWGDKNAPTILFLHGFLGDKDEWANIAHRLLPDYQILAIDLPGHGDSLLDDPSIYEMEGCAANIITLLQGLNLEKVYLVGYSMGGRLALYLAINYPKFFKNVMLLSASPGLEDEKERAQRIKADFTLARNLEREDFRSFLTKWYDMALFASLKNQPALLEQVIEKRSFNSPKHLAMSLDYMGTGRQKSLWQNLAAIEPSLDIVVGDLDAKFVAIGEKMSLLNSRARFHNIEKVGHAVYLENETAFCDLLKKTFKCF